MKFLTHEFYGGALNPLNALWQLQGCYKFSSVPWRLLFLETHRVMVLLGLLIWEFLRSCVSTCNHPWIYTAVWPIPGEVSSLSHSPICCTEVLVPCLLVALYSMGHTAATLTLSVSGSLFYGPYCSITDFISETQVVREREKSQQSKYDVL